MDEGGYIIISSFRRPGSNDGDKLFYLFIMGTEWSSADFNNVVLESLKSIHFKTETIQVDCRQSSAAHRA